MGTPKLAADILSSIIGSKHEVVLVVTNVDKAKGRNKKVEFSEVKKVAIENQIDVFQPDNFKDIKTIEKINNVEADIIVVAAYGHILPSDILSSHKFSPINVHASLLPKYRGASPIQSAILNEEDYTGVTIMKIVKELDAGEILMQKRIKIDADETTPTLTSKISKLGAGLLLESLEKIENNTVKYIPQDNNCASFTRIIKKEDGHIDFNKTSSQIKAKVRAYNPWPGTYAIYEGKTIKIIEIDSSDEHIKELKPSEILTTRKQIFVGVKDGVIEIKKLKLEGKKEMDSRSFLCGNKISGKFI